MDSISYLKLDVLLLNENNYLLRWVSCLEAAFILKCVKETSGDYQFDLRRGIFQLNYRINFLFPKRNKSFFFKERDLTCFSSFLNHGF